VWPDSRAQTQVVDVDRGSIRSSGSEARLRWWRLVVKAANTLINDITPRHKPRGAAHPEYASVNVIETAVLEISTQNCAEN